MQTAGSAGVDLFGFCYQRANMFGIAHLAATLLLLQHTWLLQGQQSNATQGTPNETLVLAASNLSVTVNQGSDFSNWNITDLDDYDFGNGTEGNVSGRNAFRYHHYRPAILSLPPPPPPPPLHVLVPAQSVFDSQYVNDAPYAEPCKCLPFYLCKVKDIVGRTDGGGLIDQRSSSSNAKATVAPKGLATRSIETGDNNSSSSSIYSRTYLGIPRPVTHTFECQKNFVCCRDHSHQGVPPPPFRPPPPKHVIAPPLPPIPVPVPTPLLPPKQGPVCGVRNINGIVGRVKNPVFTEGDTQFGEFPWHVAILKNDESGRLYICAGTLVSDQFVITAAHNIKGYNPREMRIRLGDWDVSSETETYPFVERLVTEVYIHPYFYGGNLQNDVALLRLDQPVDFGFSSHVTPVCLPPRFETFAGARCLVTGWGKDAWGLQGQYSHILKKVDLPVLTNYDCQEKLRHTRLGPNFQLSPGFLCAGGEPGKDACKGDGGGPLVCEFEGRYVLAGIVSWGIGCGLPGVPGVYVRISEYIDWINDIAYGF